MRYRLRFVLQELDLPQGGTIIGRSLDCHLTLEDPLVSRRHARIVVDDSGARIEDMGSRNGVRVNGAVIRDPVSLRNGDRVRIGTQDFVFCCVDPAGNTHSRTTGQLRLCANCRLPYPRELLACPSCEATEQTDDDTLTGSDRVTAHVWNLQLMIESLERALRMARIEDAERIVQRAIVQAEEVIGAGSSLDAETLGGLSVQAVAMSLASGDPAWAHWVLDIHGRTGRIPPIDVTEQLAGVATQHRTLIRDAIDELLRRVEASHDAAAGERPASDEPAVPAASETDEIEGLVRLRALRRTLHEAEALAAVAPKAARHLPTA